MYAQPMAPSASVATGGGASSPLTTFSIASRSLIAGSFRRSTCGIDPDRSSPAQRDGDRGGGDDQQCGHQPEDGLVGAEKIPQQRGADRRERPGAVGAERDRARDGPVVQRAEDGGDRG